MTTVSRAVRKEVEETAMNFAGLFQQRLDALHREGRYRVFADLKRRRGSFPIADHFAANGSREVTVWCSNDYLGMGQHPTVLAAMHEAIDAVGAGSGGGRLSARGSGLLLRWPAAGGLVTDLAPVLRLLVVALDHMEPVAGMLSFQRGHEPSVQAGSGCRREGPMFAKAAAHDAFPCAWAAALASRLAT